jgi:hypothetical protein
MARLVIEFLFRKLMVPIAKYLHFEVLGASPSSSKPRLGSSWEYLERIFATTTARCVS